MAVHVLTASLPERNELLAECIASICAQTLPADAHLIWIDHARAGEAEAFNRLAAASTAEWFAIIADDDLADQHHLETLLAHAAAADVVYSWCRVEGRSWSPNRHFDAGVLRERNFIPATTLVRASLWHALGGFRHCPAEDWDLWKRALEVGARFVCVPEVTWTYRFHGANQSWPVDAAGALSQAF